MFELVLLSILVGLTLVCLHALGRPLGVVLVFAFVTANQYPQTLLAGGAFFDVFGLPVSPGSSILFSSSVFAVLLLFLRQGAAKARLLIAAIVVANLSLSLVVLIVRLAVARGAVPQSSLVALLTEFSLRAFLIGTVLFVFDAFLVVVIQQLLAFGFQRLPAIVRLWLNLVVVLSLDSLLFVGLTMHGEPNQAIVLAAGVMGKTVAGSVFAAILCCYLKLDGRLDALAKRPASLAQVFEILPHRRRYNRLLAVREVQETRHRQEQRQAANALAASRAQLEQAQRMNAVGRLAGGIAHEFNNYLTVILGYSESIRFQSNSQAVHKAAEEVFDTATRAAKLTAKLLAFSRKTDGNLIETDDTRTVVDLSDAVAETLQMAGQLLDDRVQIRLDLASDLPPLLETESQIEQIVLNLILNARDAMPGGGTIEIKTETIELDQPLHRSSSTIEAGIWVVLTIRDTGVGMDEATRAQAFEPFFTTKKVGEGTGLGLSIVYGIVERMSGRAVIDSRPGAGTTFSIYLPPAPGRPAVSTAEPANAGRPPGTQIALPQLEILVVDDEPGIRHFVRDALRSDGHRVETAASVARAKQLLAMKVGAFGLLIADLGLPDGTGADVARLAMAQRPDIGVLYISGYADALDRVGDGTPLLTKPFSIADLRSAIHDAILVRAARPASAVVSSR